MKALVPGHQHLGGSFWTSETITEGGLGGAHGEGEHRREEEEEQAGAGWHLGTS